MDTPRTLSCRACGAGLAGPAVDRRRAVAACRACRAVTPLPGASLFDPARPKAPPGVTVDDDGIRLRVVRRWFAPVHLLLLPWLALWVYYAPSFAVNPGVLGLLRRAAHAAALLALAYVTAALLSNRTTVEACRHGLVTARSGPLPWRGTVAIPSDAIVQVLTTQAIRRRRADGAMVWYAVEAATTDGRRVRLAGGLIHDLEQALCVERALSAHLGLPDRPARAVRPSP